jgi:MoxR-like ATPase
VATPEQLMQLQRDCRNAYVDPALITYAVKLVGATREPAQGAPVHAPVGPQDRGAEGRCDSSRLPGERLVTE